MGSKLFDFLVDWDVYGHQIGVNYHGKGAY